MPKEHLVVVKNEGSAFISYKMKEWLRQHPSYVISSPEQL